MVDHEDGDGSIVSPAGKRSTTSLIVVETTRSPSVGASVAATVLGHLKGDKIIVFKKKNRKGYRVKNGHRQPYTQLAIGEISVGEKKKSRSKKQAEAEG